MVDLILEIPRQVYLSTMLNVLTRRLVNLCSKLCVMAQRRNESRYSILMFIGTPCTGVLVVSLSLVSLVSGRMWCGYRPEWNTSHATISFLEKVKLI